MDFLDAVIGHPQDRQVDWVTIHPRTRTTPSTIPIRSEALEILSSKYAPILPILLSGDVFDINSLPFNASSDSPTITLNDVLARDTTRQGPAPRPSNTSLSGFMSARGLLSNPALFAGYSSTPWEAVERFMFHAARAPLPFQLTVHHVHEMCSPGMGANKSALLSREERSRIMKVGSMVELVDFLDEKIEEHTGQVGGMRREF